MSKFCRGHTLQVERVVVRGLQGKLLAHKSMPPLQPDSAACRLALVLVLLSMLGFSWAVENPASSVLLLHPWLRWAIDTIKGFGGKVPFPKSISHFPLKRSLLNIYSLGLLSSVDYLTIPFNTRYGELFSTWDTTEQILSSLPKSSPTINLFGHWMWASFPEERGRARGQLQEDTEINRENLGLSAHPDSKHLSSLLVAYCFEAFGLYFYCCSK